MNLGQKEKVEKFNKMDEKEIRESIKKESLVIAYVMITEGKTRQADEAIGIYKKLEDNDGRK